MALSSPSAPLSAPAPPVSTPSRRHGRPWDRVSLLWRVFAVNLAVFVVAFAVVAWTPVTVHRVATPSELVVLLFVLLAMAAVDLLLLRRAFAPLRRLAAIM